MVPKLTTAEADALAAYPELQRLIALREAGWSFLPRQDCDGGLVEVRGVRTWPGSGSADALMVRFVTDAAGLRSDDMGGVVWQREGTLTEVVDGLLTLPAPNTPGAPQLVKASAPKLWTPGRPRRASS